MKVLIKTLLLIIIIIISILLSAFFILNRNTINIPLEGVQFQVKNGDSTYAISNKLYQMGYIRSKFLFRAIVKIGRMGNKLKTGWFKIESNYSTWKIIDTIYIKQKFIEISVTFPEGSTVKQIRDILIKNSIVEPQDIDAFFKQNDYMTQLGLNNYDSLEGFLFPETYTFVKGVSVKNIFKTMIDLFFKKVAEIYPQYKTLPQKEFYDKIILASIIEREVRVPEEAPIVASVFLNRIKIGMKLQSCATIQYILGKPKEQLFEKDVLINHPYNTYIHKGFPPGPISNPGYNSLNAAFHPKKTNYLFFVVSDPNKGTHHFSETYEDHLKAKEKYKVIKGFL